LGDGGEDHLFEGVGGVGAELAGVGVVGERHFRSCYYGGSCDE
jgi:hypothetical protein